LYEIVSFQGNPTCGNQIDANVTAQVATVMDKNNCYYGSSGGWVDVKTNFNNSVYNHRNISFKIDVDPIRGESDNPAGNIKYDVNDAQLYIEYYFTCVNSGYCPSSDFCNASGTHLCYTDLPYGAYCEGVAVDNDNYACQNNNCQFDDFDGAGHYCVESNRCVHNGTRYYTGDIHCLGNSWYKTCEGTTWSSQTNCSYGCADGTGCATTTTTTITTTTTTTTTTISGTPNILINPTTLTHRRIV